MTNGGNKSISSQASQMSITIEKLAKSKKHSILLDAAKYLNQESFNKFHKSYIDRLYHLSIQLDGSIYISRDKSIKQQRIFGNKNDQCSCKEARAYSWQYAHEIVLLNQFEPIYYDGKLVKWYCIMWVYTKIPK